jgi:uncharacterized membrane protein YheB (UPF0754 family)
VHPVLIQLLVNIAAGMVAGGVTNAIAVWMLFHPYERRFGFQGAIPKNKARLARSLGRTVGERLLTPQDMLDELSRSGLRETFDLKVASAIQSVLETERGSVRELFPPSVREELERTLNEATERIAERITAHVAGAELEAQVRRFVVRTRAELSSQPLSSVLTAERRDALTTRAAEWAAEMANSPDLERGVREYLDRHATELLSSTDPLIEKVPPAVVTAMESAIDAYLPLAVEKLGAFLSQPAARDRIREALHDVFSKFVEDLRFHERVIARIMVTERTFDKALGALERDGVEQIAALLEDPVVREEITRTIHDAVLTWLRRPISDFVGGTDDEGNAKADALVHTTGDYVLRVLRDERTRSFLVSKMHDVLERAEGRTVGDILSSVDDDTVVRWITEIVRSEKVLELATDGVRSTVTKLLDKPIGRPGRWLPDDAAPRLAAVAAPAIWEWMQVQLPGFVERLNIESMVERKVLGFSTQRVEEIIRGVTEKELRLIVHLGYVLGAVIGIVTFGISMIFRNYG